MKLFPLSLPFARAALLAVVFLALPSTAGAHDGDDSALRIDPLLVVEAAAVWEVIAAPQNEIWPGWNASETPILFYLPGQQDLLINHPSPPAGFQPYSGPLEFPGGRILVRSGQTLIGLDGQNTSRSIEGVETLVVADTLSNRKLNVHALIQDPRPADEKLESVDYPYLAVDPYTQMAMIAHEAFHVFQSRAVPGAGADERSLIHYPTLSVHNNVGFALEGEALSEALEAKTDTQRREAALRWLAVRDDRRSALPDEAVRYEDGTELNEGLAKYVEWRLFEVLEGRQPPRELFFAQGFHGYDDLGRERTRLVDDLRGFMSGARNVNNDRFGTAPLRMRLYYSGMAIAALLDGLEADWKSNLLQPGASLTALARQALAADDATLPQALARARTAPGYEELVDQKEELAREGRLQIEQRLQQILDGPHTLFVIDYSRVEAPDRLRMAFTPFGITAVDDHRTIFAMTPFGAQVRPNTAFQQSEPSPVLQDREAKTFSFQLREKLSEEAVLKAFRASEPPREPQAIQLLQLPGVNMNVGLARWSFDGRVLTLHLE